MSVGPLEIGIIVLIVILLFGAKKLPDAARSLGRSARIFKSEIKEMSNDDKRFEEQNAIEAHKQAPTVTPEPIDQADTQKPNQQV